MSYNLRVYSYVLNLDALFLRLKAAWKLCAYSVQNYKPPETLIVLEISTLTGH